MSNDSRDFESREIRFGSCLEHFEFDREKLNLGRYITCMHHKTGGGAQDKISRSDPPDTSVCLFSLSARHATFP